MQPSKMLTEASKLLSPYIEMTDRHALTAELLEGGADTLSFSGNNVTVENAIKNAAMSLHEIVDGGTTISKFADEMRLILTTDQATSPVQKQQIAQKVREFIRITAPGTEGKIGNYSQLEISESTQPSDDDKCYLNDLLNYKIKREFTGQTGMTLKSGGIVCESNLYAVEFLNPRLGLPGRDTPAIAAFTSLVPNIEMSKCVPYVNISMTSSGSIPQGQPSPTYSGLSLMSFLIGKGEKSPGNGLDDFLSFGSDSQARSGMEIFTSPQTLLPTRDSNSLTDNRRGQGPHSANVPAVIDRFRPLLSLRSVSFSVVPTRGIMSYKSGKLEVVLHDRSRLPEVAALVKPGLYESTDIDIEYGWSHPAGKEIDVKRNPIGSFLNSLRAREKYKVINSSYNFEDSGQVNISLSIAMKGNDHIVSTDISACNENNAAKKIHEILQEISKMISSSQQLDKDRFTKIFGDVILTAVSSESSALSLDEEKLREIREKIKVSKLSKNSVDKTIADKLESLFDVTDGPLNEFKSTARQAVSTELQNLYNGIEIFPCTDEQLSNSKHTIKLFEPFDGIKSQEIKVPISLGRVLMSFVGKPLSNNKEAYKEVQFLFHTFNDKCTFMRDLSIAKFPIPYDELKKEIEELMTKNTRVTIPQFIMMLNERFVGNMAAHAYGFNFLYTVDEKGNPKRVEPNEESSKKIKEEFQARQYGRQDRVIELSGIRDGTFRLPKLAVIPECVPDKNDPSKSILRMHVVDEQCSSFSSISELIRAANDIDITMYGFTNDPEHPLLKSAPELNGAETEKNRRTIMQKLMNDGVVKKSVKSTDQNGTKTTRDEPAIELDIDPGVLLEHNSINMTKRFVSRAFPTIVYGRETGTIKNIGLQSISDPALSTTNLLRQAKSDGTSPELLIQRGLPIQVAPTECSLEMLGCPLLSYMQQFFIDFGTGTTADNTYSVTGIEHKIEPGSFSTSVKLTFTDSFAKYTSQIKKVKTASAMIRSMFGENSTPETSATLHQPNRGKNISRQIRGIPSAFFTVTGLKQQGIIERLVSEIFPSGGPPRPVEFAASIDKKCNAVRFSIGPNAQDTQIAAARSLNGCLVVSFTLDSSTKGDKSIAVINPVPWGYASQEECESISKIGPTPRTGQVITNFDEFHEAIKKIKMS